MTNVKVSMSFQSMPAFAPSLDLPPSSSGQPVQPSSELHSSFLARLTLALNVLPNSWASLFRALM